MLGRKVPIKVLTKKTRKIVRNGGRDPGVSAQSRSIQRHAINDRSTRTKSPAANNQLAEAWLNVCATDAGWAFQMMTAVRPTAIAMRRNREKLTSPYFSSA